MVLWVSVFGAQHLESGSSNYAMVHFKRSLLLTGSLITLNVSGAEGTAKAGQRPTARPRRIACTLLAVAHMCAEPVVHCAAVG